MASPFRHTILLLLCTLILFACTKDPAIEPAGVEVCNEFILPVSIDHDTITMHYTDFSASTAVNLHSPYVPSLYLATYTLHYFAWINQTSIMVELRGAAADSVGVFQAQWISQSTPGSFEVGDTLSPYAQIHASEPLYFYDSFAGVNAAPPRPIWYFGFVQIIDGEKYVGYVRIGASTDGGYRFWIEDARLAECPGMPIVITE